MTGRDFISQIRSQNEVRKVMVNRPITYEFAMFTKGETELQETDKLIMNLLQSLLRMVVDSSRNGIPGRLDE
jgi:hypothetical protein